MALLSNETGGGIRARALLGRMKRKNEKILTPLRPNVGLEYMFRRALVAAIAAMHEDVERQITAAWGASGANPPAQAVVALAQDEPPPVGAFVGLVRRLIEIWAARFNAMGQELAAYFAQAVQSRSDATLKNILKRGGIAVEWHMSPRVQSILQATIQQNVALIKSIPEQYLGQVEQSVMRSVQTGRDLKQLQDDLIQLFGVAKRRAALIAKDQNNKATAAINRERALEAGAKYAIWMHSSAGKTWRKTHVAMNGKRYDIAKGMWDSDERKWVNPGELINCKCSSRIVISGIAS